MYFKKQKNTPGNEFTISKEWESVSDSTICINYYQDQWGNWPPSLFMKMSIKAVYVSLSVESSA